MRYRLFRIKDKKVADVADYLFKQHQVLIVNRALGKQGCIRVTPAIYTSADEVKKIVDAIMMYVSQA